jgi:invasion protein IalB
MRRVCAMMVGGLLCLAADAGAAQNAAGTQQQAAPQPHPPAWSTACSGTSRSSAADCVIEQRVFLSESGQLFGALSIRIPADTHSPVMMLQLPLGLFLPAGVSLAVDGGTAQTLAVQTCEASGCYVGSPLSADLLSAMKKGTQLGITFQNTQKKTITMPISLAGFTTAYSSIE